MTDNALTDFDARDFILLQARIANPTASSRELSDILDETYGISLSHNHVNTLLREMETEGLFRKTVVPRRTLFKHYVFRIAFHYPNYKEHWEECYDTLVNDPHVLMFFNADDKYRWQLIAQFRSTEQMDEWVTEFFEEHGSVIDEFETTSVHNLHKFKTDAAIFDDLIAESEEGREYLEDAETAPASSDGSPESADRDENETE